MAPTEAFENPSHNLLPIKLSQLHGKRFTQNFCLPIIRSADTFSLFILMELCIYDKWTAPAINFTRPPHIKASGIFWHMPRVVYTTLYNAGDGSWSCSDGARVRHGSFNQWRSHHFFNFSIIQCVVVVVVRHWVKKLFFSKKWVMFRIATYCLRRTCSTRI